MKRILRPMETLLQFRKRLRAFRPLTLPVYLLARLVPRPCPAPTAGQGR